MMTTHRYPLLGALLGALIALPAAAQTPDSRQSDLDWAQRRDIREIHKRLFLKESRWEFNIFSGVIPNDDFYTYFPVGMNVDYWFVEDLAGELGGAWLGRHHGALEGDVESDLQPPIAGVQVLLPQSLLGYANLGALWTPIHGKIGAGSSMLGHFDLGLLGGLLTLWTDVQKEGQTEAKLRGDGVPDFGGYVGASLRFYLNSLMAVRVDYRHFFYTARDADDNSRGVSYPLQIAVGLCFFTPEPK